MNAVIQKLKTEPAMVASTVLAFLAYFGVRLSEDEASTVSQLVTVLGPLIAGLVIRSQVAPEATRAQRDNAVVADTMARVARGDIDPLDGGE